MTATIHGSTKTITGKTIKEIRSKMNGMLRDGRQAMTATTNTGTIIHVELWDGQDYIKTANGRIIK